MRLVMPREGHGSRNKILFNVPIGTPVMPREGHGSRNTENQLIEAVQAGHAPRGAWE